MSGNKKKITIIISIIAVAVILAGVAVAVFISLKNDMTAKEISKDEAQQLVNEALDAMAIEDAVKLVAEKNNITVNSMTYGNEKDIILDCTVTTVDVYSAVVPHYSEFLGTSLKKPTGMVKSTLNFKKEFENKLVEMISSAEVVEKDCTIYIYDTLDGMLVYASDEVIDSVYGGIATMAQEIDAAETYTVINENGEEEIKEIEGTNINKGFALCLSLRGSTDKPDTSTAMVKWWNGIKKDFKRNFIDHDRWKTIVNGLWVTIKLTIFSLLIGIVIGFLVAFVRCTYIKTSKPGILIKIFNGISQIYLTVVRGTPVVVQIMIIYFVIFMPLNVDKFLSAVICFGLNSGAYVAEIVRGGIMSVDNGQIEAGRSLGFGYMATMIHIVFPQAFKAVLPALANEFVVLLKETSIAFYIGLGDLMYAGNAIRAATYSAFMPLVAVAIIYLIMVLVLSKLVGILERKLRNNER